MLAVTVQQRHAFERDTKRAIATYQMMRMSPGIEVLPIILKLDTNKCGFGNILVGSVGRDFDIADQVRGPWHRRENERPCLKEAAHADGENRVIFIDYRGHVLCVRLPRLAWHPIDALRCIQFEPSLEFPGIEQLAFVQKEQLDFPLEFIR